MTRCLSIALALAVLAACGSDADEQPAASAVSAEETTAVPADATSAEPGLPDEVPQPIPDFSQLTDVKAKKEAFFVYMEAKVRAANDDVWAERLFVQSERLRMAAGEALEADEEAELRELGDYYKLPAPEVIDDAWFEALLKRVDTIPASLVLAQAANESGWGSSRFAREGRNFFGIWCYSEGCGLKPRHRNEGATHEVRSYPTVLQGVRDYIHNINVGGAYEQLRDIRAALRAEAELPPGSALAEGLERYSERGEEYVKELRAMIRGNELSRFTVDRRLD